MSKTYAAPTLATRGNLIELTQFGVGGVGDPANRYPRAGHCPREHGVSALS